MGKLPVFDLLNKTFKTFKVGNLNIDATYWEAITIIILIFLLIFTLARLRFLYVHWSMGKNAFAMLFWGVVLTIILEGFMMLSGRTLFTEILGMRNVPKPFSTLLAIGRQKFTDVLGQESTVPYSSADYSLNSDQMYTLYSKMDQSESQRFREILCQP